MADTTSKSWRTVLAAKMPEDWAREIDIFATEMALRQQGKIDDKVFAETRLRRGTYGQRYDNGQRHDGAAKQDLAFPSDELKGPNTLWHAPGMQRIKLPYGAMSAEQMETLANIADEYSNGVLHVTTRQDIQLHYIHIEDTPDMMRRLAAVGITTREACGNSVRNVTACPLAGVCNDESFDVTPYAHALTFFLLGHEDAQDFGRKFKIAFSGCVQHACGLAHMHDIGAVGVIRARADGTKERGFQFYVGGGLGSVPYQAKLLWEFLPEHELLPMSQAVCRVFARLGEKKNRARARLKFVVAKLGVEEFRKAVEEERKLLTPDPRWTSYLKHLEDFESKPVRPPSAMPKGEPSPELQRWLRTNLRHQAQEGYGVATITLPLGDLTSLQMRALADLSRRYTGDNVRTTVEQNIVFRWLPLGDVAAFYEGLAAVGLHESGAETIVDVTSCPGTDTCKLGISSSRGLAGELRSRLAARAVSLDEAVGALRIKVSGCFNACGQHHVADMGFLGVSRKVGGFVVPHFQVVLGGQWSENAGAFGLAIGAVPSKRIPEVVDRMTESYVRGRTPGESFQAFIKRIGKVEIREMLQDLMQTPAYQEDPSFYSDWGDPRQYSIGDMGVGECAGEVISPAEFGLVASERGVFEAQVQLDKGNANDAAALAYRAMLQAATALAKARHLEFSPDPASVVEGFRKHFYDTQLFFDPYAGGKFAHFLFRAHEQGESALSEELAHQRVEEAQLFIEAAHSCYGRLSTS